MRYFALLGLGAFLGLPIAATTAYWVNATDAPIKIHYLAEGKKPRADQEVEIGVGDTHDFAYSDMNDSLTLRLNLPSNLSVKRWGTLSTVVSNYHPIDMDSVKLAAKKSQKENHDLKLEIKGKWDGWAWKYYVEPTWVKAKDSK